MTTDSLYISAVRLNSNQFHKRLGKIKDSGLSILFIDCILSIRSGIENVISTQVGACLYNEDENVLLLIEKGDFSIKDLEQMLTKKGILFHKVFYNCNRSFDYDKSNVMPVSFVEGKNCLEEKLKQSDKYSTGVYYPKIGSSIGIRYCDKDEISFPLDYGECSGVIALSEEFIVLLNFDKDTKKTMDEVSDVFIRNKMKLITDQGIHVKENTGKIRSKAYEKRFGNITGNYKTGS